MAPDLHVLDAFLDHAKLAWAVPFTTFAGATPKTKDELRAAQRKEIDLWHTWNNGGRKPADLKPLHDAFKPFINTRARTYINRVELPTSAILAEYNRHFVQAVKTYNPQRAQLNTWIDTHLRKASRYVKTYQNFGHISERQIGGIRKFDEAKNELTTKFGHEPDTHTLADHLGWPHRRVVQLIKERRADYPVSGYLQDPAEILSPKELEAIHLLQHDSRLSSQDRVVYEYVFGMNGRPALKPGQIAKQTGFHPSKVSRIRNKLKGLTQEILETV